MPAGSVSVWRACARTAAVAAQLNALGVQDVVDLFGKRPVRSVVGDGVRVEKDDHVVLARHSTKRNGGRSGEYTAASGGAEGAGRAGRDTLLTTESSWWIKYMSVRSCGMPLEL